MNLKECGNFGICRPLGDHQRNGLCHCDAGYEWEETVGDCVATQVIPTESPVVGGNTNSFSISTTPITQNYSYSSQSVFPGGGTALQPPVEKLLVNINNKTVELQEGSSIYEGTVTLSAYAIGGEFSLISDLLSWTSL